MLPIEAYIEFQRETIRFISAQNFFLRSALHAERGDAALAAQLHKFDKAVKPAYDSPEHYLTSRLFVTYVSAFEIYLSNLVYFCVAKNPKKLGSSQLRLADVIDAEDVSVLVNRAIEEHLNHIMYKRPAEYLSELCAILSIDKSLFEKQWSIFVEAKARRDLGVHNDWKCNATYLRKVREVEVECTSNIGDSLVPDPSTYLNRITVAMDILARDIGVAVSEKHGLEMEIFDRDHA